MVICPFCGRETTTEDHCSRCHTIFNKEIRKIAYSTENDPRSDRIGPFSTKAAKIICWVVLGLLLISFVLATELSGNGVSNWGK